MSAAATLSLLRALSSVDRARVEAMTRAVGLFRDEEIPVALHVFDEATGANPTGRVDPDYEALGVEADGRLVGWACWGPVGGTLGTFDLYWIVVDPEYQGRGCGGRLLEEMERAVTGRARLVVVETAGRADYAPTRSFYERHGYRVCATIPDFYAPGDDQVTFVKSFTSR